MDKRQSNEGFWGSVEVPIRGHFLLQEPESGLGRRLILGFHGYAEDAPTQFRRLQSIPKSQDDWLVSVQALHPFYRRSTGEVVASWMTRFQREVAIEENRDYIDRVLHRVREKISEEVPLVLTGFSQGAAMAYRACLSERHQPTALIILGGDLPPDLAERSDLELPPILLGRGKEDRFYPAEQFQRDIDSLAKKGTEVTACEFDGGHEWNEVFSTEVGAFLEKVTGV